MRAGENVMLAINGGRAHLCLAWNIFLLSLYIMTILFINPLHMASSRSTRCIVYRVGVADAYVLALPGHGE